MSVYKAPLQDMEFIFNEVLQVQDSEIPGYKDLDNDFLKSILNEAGKICSDILFPLNHVGDNQGCSLENGIVQTPILFQGSKQPSLLLDSLEAVLVCSWILGNILDLSRGSLGLSWGSPEAPLGLS